MTILAAGSAGIQKIKNLAKINCKFDNEFLI
jgi:hypothetical protein